MESPMIRALTFAVLAAAATPSAMGQVSPAGCRPLGLDKTTMLELRADEFGIDDPQKRQRFAIELLECLGDPDPDLRDKVAYEGLATLLRGKRLETDTIRSLRTRLIAMMTGPEEDRAGFRRPFAALVLSEVARYDRVDPLFTDPERDELVQAAATYLRSVDDYRGFDEAQGWRHGVAHAADILMQLALNPALDREQLTRIRDAVASQIVPGDAHYYVYGEPERLARPILFVAMRGVFSDEEWAGWFEGIASPAPFEAWQDVFASQAGLAKLHNTKGFVQVVYVNASASDKAELDALEAAALSVMRGLP
jgi:hypothetical protein